MGKLISLGIITLSCSIWLAGCSTSTIGNEQTSNIYIEKDQAKQLDIDLTIDYGQVNISAGAGAWVEGDITYNLNKLEPQVAYKQKRDKGTAKIDQPKKSKVNVKKGALKNDWDLQLTNDIPVDLKVDTGASDTYMNLQGMQLQSLNIETGVGRSTVNLGGVWKQSFDVYIEMGVGESTVILPKDIGVKIKSTKGIGSANFNGFISKDKDTYVNEAFEHADVIITVQTELGIGSANFEIEE